MSDFSLRAIPALKPILLVQLLNLSDLQPETPDLFPENYKVIHTNRIIHLESLSVGRGPIRQFTSLLRRRHHTGLLLQSPTMASRRHSLVTSRILTKHFLPEATVQRRGPMLVLVLLVSVIVLASAQFGSQRQSLIRPVDGASIFGNYCAACHGLDGRRNGPVSKALKHEVPDPTRLSLRNHGTFPVIHVRTIIMFGADNLLPAHGSKEMPIWGPIFHEIEFDQDLGNVRLENVTKYLESIQRK